jgi:hypothetical protein
MAVGFTFIDTAADISGGGGNSDDLFTAYAVTR